MLLLGKYFPNCQTCFGCSECKWVNSLAPFCVGVQDPACKDWGQRRCMLLRILAWHLPCEKTWLVWNKRKVCLNLGRCFTILTWRIVLDMLTFSSLCHPLLEIEINHEDMLNCIYIEVWPVIFCLFSTAFFGANFQAFTKVHIRSHPSLDKENLEIVLI